MHPSPPKWVSTPDLRADFLDALVSLGLLNRDDEGIYRNSPTAEIFLDRAKPSYVGGILEMANARLFGFWDNLTDALRTGTQQNEVTHTGAPFFATLSQDPVAWRNFLNGMNGVSTPLAGALASDFDWSGRQHLVDLGGALGAVPAAVLQSHPEMTGTVLELPPVRPVFEEFVARHGLSDRLSFHGGDFFSDPLPPADVYVMGQILHDWNLEQRQFLLRKAYDALPDGGTLIVYDAMIDDDRRHNTYGFMVSLNMLIDTEGGSEYTVRGCDRLAGGSRLLQGELSSPHRRIHGHLRHQVIHLEHAVERGRENDPENGHIVPF